MRASSERAVARGSIRLLGVRVDAVTQQDVLNLIERAAEERARVTIAYANAHALNLAYTQPEFRAFFNDCADVVFCDGFGVRLGARLAGAAPGALPERMTPPDWIDALCTRCAARGRSMYLLGGAGETAQRAAAELARRHLGLRIAGSHHGYFDKRRGSAENRDVIACINAAAPDVLLVGFGMPLQEFWLRDNRAALSAAAAITVGALFSHLSGEARRAPRWMTDHGLEWLGRLAAEPGRLWRRYLVGLPVFLARVVGQRLGMVKIE
jgi:N-acetylglucosaminyldiphosphoundecaprenol N-acetyl-beta-D-mannosaminyltransferase